jgi:zinc/manganese transport system permease protein
MEALTFLFYPVLGCVLLILIHAYFGIHILERGIIFVDLAMAQIIALGIALALLLGHEDAMHRTVYAILFAILGASILSMARRIQRIVNMEAFIGVLYIFSLAGSILILDRTPHGLEEFRTILNGNILWVTPSDILKTFLLYAAIGLLHLIFRKKFFALSYEESNGPFWEFLFFLSFAFVLVSSVQLAGILQVFSFLVIPALIGRLFTRSPMKILIGGWGIGLAASMVGITLSYKLDFPTAPLIVASLSVAFFLLLILRIGRMQRTDSLRNTDSSKKEWGTRT